MGQISEFKKVKLFCGLIFSQSAAATQAKVLLGERFSAIDSQSPPIPVALTDYYQVEMGAPLYRQFISFEKLLAPETLPEIKIFTNSLEKQLAGDGNRTINLDPGYISDANVIIATSKNHYHRVPLQRGIYAHLEYILKNKQLSFLPWTYPDFQTEEYLAFFRQLYILFKQIKQNSRPGAL
jgi:hypothetical protein